MADRVRSTAVSTGPGAVLLDGWALRLVDQALARALPSMVEGWPSELVAEAQRVREVVGRGADLTDPTSDPASDPGNRPLPPTGGGASCMAMSAARLTITEAVERAAAAGVVVSSRQLRNLAPSLGGRQAGPGASWTIDELAFAGWLDRKAAA